MKSLNEENTISASFFLKSIPTTVESILLIVENNLLENNYSEANVQLNSLNQSELNKCQKVKISMLKGLISLAYLKYSESNNHFNLSLESVGECSDEPLVRAQIEYWFGYALLSQKNLNFAKKNLFSSLRYYKKDSLVNFIKLAKLYFWIGTTYQEQGKPDSALLWLERSLKIFENTPLDKSGEIAKVYNNMGNAYSELWDYSRTINSYSKSIDLNKKKNSNANEVAFAFANLGSIYSKYENYLKAEECYKTSFNWMKQANIDPPRKATIIQNFGTVLTKSYRNHEALDYYSQALKVISPYQSSHKETHLRILLNMMSTYSNLEMYQEAMAINEQLSSLLLGGNEQWRENYINWRLWNANHLIKIKAYEEALQSLEEVEKYYNDSNMHVEYSEMLLLKATCIAKLESHEESRKQYHKGISLLRSLLPTTHPLILYFYNSLGGSFFEDTNYDSAMYYFKKAKSENLLENSKIDFNELYSSKIEWIVSNYNLLMIDQRRFSGGQISVQNLEDSEGLIYSTLSVLESKRIEFRNEQDATNLYRMTRDFFDEAIKFYFTLYHHTGDKQYIDKAFFISEKSKYQTLQNAMKLDRVNAFAGVTTKVMQEEQKLGHELAQLEYQYSQELAKQEEPLLELVQEYINNWRANSNRHNELVDSIKNNLPDYYNLKFNRSTTEINQLQSSILTKNQEMAWVSYYFGYTETYAIVITHDQKHFLKLDPSEKITRQLKSFNNYISQQMNDEFHQSSYDIYQLLFKSIDSCLVRQAKKIKQIVIIPDGPLNYLNFELLGKPTAKSWHYALYDYQFSYGYSSTLLWTEFSDQLKWKPEALSMIGFAPEFEGYSKSETKQTLRDGSEKPDYDFFGFSPLHKNQDEVKQVAQILGQKKGKTSVYLGSQADESSFKKANLGSFNIIHLATHGFVSGQQQNIAGIAFARKENSTDDGILYMDEIFSLKNKANLVCLSACETGSGVFQQGEGLVGLTRAFIYSGAQNLVVSLWKVQDESTSELMAHFYKGLVKSRSVSQSLHDAKITMIKKNPTLQPYHWSAFIHVGLN